MHMWLPSFTFSYCWLILIESTQALSLIDPKLNNNKDNIADEYSFVDEVTQWLETENVNFQPLPIQEGGFGKSRLLSLTTENNNNNNNSSNCNPTLLLHLLPAPTSLHECVASTFTRTMTEEEEEVGIIHLHEDVWESKQRIVKDRLCTRLGRSQQNKKKRIFARKTNVRRIDSLTATSFLERNHLWSSTKAKYSYGLFSKEEEELLVAVATFSSRRKVMRGGIPFRSHELLRFCCQSDGTVIGGLSKLVKAFCRQHNPDDVVTVIDRDWGGSGSGWRTLGFETVQIMPPLVMAVRHHHHRSRRRVQRHHLIGAGIVIPQSSNSDDNDDNSDASIIEISSSSDDTTTTTDKNKEQQPQDRLGLPINVLEQLTQIREKDDAINCLIFNGYYPVYDVGVERLFMIVDKQKQQHLKAAENGLQELWKTSIPTYSSTYYSNNIGIATIL